MIRRRNESVRDGARGGMHCSDARGSEVAGSKLRRRLCPHTYTPVGLCAFATSKLAFLGDLVPETQHEARWHVLNRTLQPRRWCIILRTNTWAVTLAARADSHALSPPSMWRAATGILDNIWIPQNIQAQT